MVEKDLGKISSQDKTLKTGQTDPNTSSRAIFHHVLGCGELNQEVESAGHSSDQLLSLLLHLSSRAEHGLGCGVRDTGCTLRSKSEKLPNVQHIS